MLIAFCEASMKPRSGKDFTESCETNKGPPQGDSISGVVFNIAFCLRMLSDIGSELIKNNLNIKYSYIKVSFPPTEMTFPHKVK